MYSRTDVVERTSIEFVVDNYIALPGRVADAPNYFARMIGL